MYKIFFLPIERKFKILKILLVLLFTTTFLFAQTNSTIDSSINNIEKILAKSKRINDSIRYPLKYAKSLEDYLLIYFSENSNKDGRWVYKKVNAELEKIDKPTLKAVLPNSEFYKVKLTNYLGWHINRGTCIIVFDSTNAKFTFAEPLWYSGISKNLIKLFINHKFDNEESLLKSITELTELMEIGSVYKFRRTNISDKTITYDLGFFKGNNYSTGGNETKSTINYNEDGVWRKIIFNLKDFAFIRYTSINPINNGKEIIK